MSQNLTTTPHRHARADRLRRGLTRINATPLDQGITHDANARRTDYLYDPVARLTGIWAANNDIITFIRDRGGRLTEKWLPTGVNTRYTYNDDNTLQRLANRTYGGSVISHNAYTYDGVGNRNTATEKAGSVTTPPMSEAYGYDPLGNRTYKSDGSATFYYLHDSANQLKEVRLNTPTGPLSGTLIYDANGNLLQKCEGGTVTATPTACTGTTVTTLAYDVYQRLVQVQKTGLATQTYQYDNQGRRISKTIGTATTNYLYNGDNVHAEYSAWSAAASYTHGPGTDDPLIRTTPTTHQYYHKDGLGSIVAMTDSTSATTGTQLYDAWGNKLAVTASGSIAQYGYTGREPDETGLIYYRARYYDPSTGRFTQRDPIGLAGGINTYAYVYGNPTNMVDPDGKLAFFWHGGITYFAARDAGYGVGDSLGLAWDAMVVDFVHGSQGTSPNVTAIHGLRGIDPVTGREQSVSQANEGSDNYLNWTWQNGRLGEGSHNLQDRQSQSHQGEIWRGFSATPWSDMVVHLWYDFFPSLEAVGTAYTNTRGFLEAANTLNIQPTTTLPFPGYVPPPSILPGATITPASIGPLVSTTRGSGNTTNSNQPSTAYQPRGNTNTRTSGGVGGVGPPRVRPTTSGNNFYPQR